MSLDDLDSVFSGSGAKSAFNKYSAVGSSVTGTITDVSIQQITDYVTGKPKFWDGDRPQNQLVIILQTALNEGVDDQGREDNGRRAVYIKTWGIWKENLMKAVRAAGFAKVSEALVPGAVFTDTLTGTKPSAQGSDTKVHEYRIQPAAQASLDDAMGADTATGELPTPVVQAPAPAPVAVAPAAATAPAAAAPAAANDPVTVAKQLIGLGIDDATIIQSTGLDPVVLNALRNAAA